MTEKSTGVETLDNARLPPFSAQLTHLNAPAGQARAKVRTDYSSAEKWKATESDRVTLRNGPHAWTMFGDRVFIQPAAQVAQPFSEMLWATYRSKKHIVGAMQEIELEDGRPGYLAQISYRSGAVSTHRQLRVDRASGLVLQLTYSATDSDTVQEFRLDNLSFSPAFTDHDFEAMVPPTVQVISRTQALPRPARRLLIGLVGLAAIPWNRLRHPERR